MQFKSRAEFITFEIIHVVSDNGYCKIVILRDSSYSTYFLSFSEEHPMGEYFRRYASKCVVSLLQDSFIQ